MPESIELFLCRGETIADLVLLAGRVLGSLILAAVLWLR